MHPSEIDIITLGCSKNLVDAERVMRRLECAGYRCVHDAPDPQGEIAIINTCGFIGDAKEESINMILEMVERKKRRKLKKLYVMGCLSQRYMQELTDEIPEVDGWYGKFDYDALVECLIRDQKSEIRDQKCAAYERTITTPGHYTYVKISEGCNRFCSYCAIPLITGRHQSRPMEEILDEVRWLVSQGVKEFNVIAQDLSSYGLDIYKEHKLAELIEQMAQVEGVEWIRLHYAYPTDFPYDILPVMAKHKNVCKYLDIALQHCTDHMLSLMRRHITADEQNALLDRIRREVPGITLRTTLMVGHPGETDEDFEALKAWVKQQRFDRMGAFAYSEEEGTYAANHYKDDVPEPIKQQRLDELMLSQEQIAAEKSEEKVGTVQRVIIDREEGDYFIGRTEADSPEVDCEVLVSNQQSAAGSQLKVGEFYDIKITGYEGVDLFGRL
ncbi:MAG: 30S ribosomal protein S12 methylthiotransferase RimO [Paludibacteraceae bacterium]|nr:30S ribosomal protein S12 methylthiotransferase RimO [Paludibacteraceae bacterium]